MSRERATALTYLDVLDRVLDKGMVVDAWVRISLGGLDLVTLEARIVVASLGTYLERSAEIRKIALGAAPKS
jgi:gas vesicle structural protein